MRGVVEHPRLVTATRHCSIILTMACSNKTSQAHLET
jgi:hypothetical protein